MNRKRAYELATKLVDQMTVDEMASQLKFHAPAISRLGVEEYNWWNEGLHGVARAGTATVFPQAIGLGATFDKELLEQIGTVIAVEARAKYNSAVAQNDRDIYKGLTLWSPNVNLFRDPRWGRGQETYGEDPELIARLGVSFIRGIQGDGEYLKVAACAKHFAVHSGPEAVRHEFDAKTSKKDLWETYLPAFEACVTEAKVEAVMGAYNRTNGEACCAHSYLMKDVLRGKWKFEGHYVSDCWAVKDFHERHHITESPLQSVTLALETGCDLNCGCTYENIMKAYDAGMLDETYIRESAIRLFTTRFLLGEFEKTEYDEIPYEIVECKQHVKLSEQASRESIVLLKNDGILPLHKDEIKTIGVIGPNADSREALIGNYHGTASRYITVLEGIQDAVGDDIRVLYSKGCHLSEDREEPLAKQNDRLSEAVTVANCSELVILCLGLNETLEGEEGDTGNSYASGDKLDLSLPASQQTLLNTVLATKKPVIVIMMSGSAMDLNIADEQAEAVIQAWYPGARGGRAVADILFGTCSPSGKLPITFYKDLEDFPEFTDYSMKQRTYRYLTKTPLYPFGYGLSYGIPVVKATNAETIEYDKLEQMDYCVDVTIANESDVATEEVLQVYVKVCESVHECLHPKLALFERVTLAAREEKVVSLTIPSKAFATINEEGERIFDGTGADLFIGFGQPDDRTRELYQRESYGMHIHI